MWKWVAIHYIDGSVRPQKIVLAAGPVYEIEEAREEGRAKASTTGELARRFGGKNSRPGNAAV